MPRRAPETDDDSTESRPTEPRPTEPRPRRRWGYRVLISAGLLLVASAVAWQARATLWTTHSDRVGRALIRSERQAQHKAATEGTDAPCTTTPDTGGPEGLLVIPAIGLTAPVEQGTDDAELNVAVGHVPSSVWPGTTGNAVMEAHDVSYFVNIDELNPGDTIEYQTACTTYTYKVEGHQVIQQGSTVYNTPSPTLSLVTCWPTDALWFTPTRYLVTADEVQATPDKGTAAAAGAVPASATPPTVPAPAALVSQGLTLATNSILMGTMSVSGPAEPTWIEGPGPLAVQSSAVESFIGGTKALEQNQLGWWNALAPGVTAPAPLVGAHVTGYDASLDVTVSAAGTTPTSVQLADTVTIAGGSAPGRYVVNVTQNVTQGQLVIAGWTLTPS
ncbi:MAG: class D sortase [Acidimicrobiales bacterium]